MIIMAKKSLKDVRTDNTAQVLECILKQGQSSRMEIAEKTMLSPSTVGQAVALLMEKGLVEEAGRLELPGRPISYRTTPVFLRCFGLGSLEDLPDVTGEEEPQGEEDDQLTLPGAGLGAGAKASTG